MNAVVLAAGKGTRLQPLTDDKPEGMVEVAGKPLLTHCFEQLLVVVGYKKEAIIEHYGDKADRRLQELDEAAATDEVEG